MKAIQKIAGCDFNLLHTKVIEVNGDNPKYKRFKCLRCGVEWKDCTTAPILIDEKIAKNIKNYYPNYRNCISVQDELMKLKYAGTSTKLD